MTLKDADAVRAEIERRAYLRFCARGCAPGDELEDWLAAEREVRTLVPSQGWECEAPADLTPDVSRANSGSRRDHKHRRRT